MLDNGAASQKLSEEEVLQKGMEAKAVEFVKQGPAKERRPAEVETVR